MFDTRRQFSFPDILSRGNFCTKKIAVVKTTEGEKIGTLSILVVFDYVNRFVYPLFTRAVERGCGKSCGQCGKVCVFNRYSDLFNSMPGCEKNCIGRCIRSGFFVYARVTSMFVP